MKTIINAYVLIIFLDLIDIPLHFFLIIFQQFTLYSNERVADLLRLSLTLKFVFSGP